MNFRHRTIIRLLLVVLMLGLVLGAISAQDERNVIRFAQTWDPPLLVDYVSNSGFAWAANRIHAHEAWGMDREGNLIPLLVDEIPSAENGGFAHTDDGKTIVSFTIADWALWSDGTPITADDFILVYDIHNDDITNSVTRFIGGADVESVVQGDTEKDVIITIATPIADVINTAVTPLPNHILRDEYEAALANGQGFETLDYIRNPSVSSGPFILDEWVSGSFLRFVKNEYYPRDIWADELVINIYPDATVVKQIMANDEADYTTSISDPLDASEFVSDNSNLEIATSFGGTRLEVHINHGEGGGAAVRDQRVRQAMWLAIDRESIANDLFDGLMTASRSYWDGTPWYNPDTPVPDADMDAAKALLREAGWYDDDGDSVAEAHGVDGVDDGTPLTIRMFSYSDGWGGPYSASALVVQDMLSDLGMDIDLTLMLWSAIAAPYDEGGIRNVGNYDIVIGGRGAGLQSISQTRWWDCSDIPGPDLQVGNNYQFYCNDDMDALWDVVDNSLDDQERLDAAYEIQQIMADDVVSIFLVNLPSVAIMSANLENVETAPGSSTLFYNLHEWQISE